MDRESLRLYAITDRAWLKNGEKLSDVVEQAIIGGASIIQLREKKLEHDELLELALSVKAVCNRYNVPFIINDDVRLAREINADGVHVGANDMAVAEARTILGPDKIVGATAKTIEQAVVATRDGADYLGSGAIFGTTTKADAKPMTKELLAQIIASVDIPVVAIGGIDEDNVVALADMNLAGVAVVSGIFAKENKLSACHNIIKNLYGPAVVQCITNPVTVNEVANVILATGGSPIMAHHPLEVEEIQSNASALLLNLGATDDYEAMKKAYAKAIEKGHPVVIDPVGVGGSSFRRQFLSELLELGSPTVIRGNFGEIKAIFNFENTMNGLDFSGLADASIVGRLAEQLSCIVVSSGVQDIISDGRNEIIVSGGTAMQKSVTGAGCMLSAVIASFLANNHNPSVEMVAWISSLMKDTAKMSEAQGSMSFLARWIDSIYIKCNR